MSGPRASPTAEHRLWTNSELLSDCERVGILSRAVRRVTGPDFTPFTVRLSNHFSVLRRDSELPYPSVNKLAAEHFHFTKIPCCLVSPERPLNLNDSLSGLPDHIL